MTILGYSNFPCVEWIWKFPHSQGKGQKLENLLGTSMEGPCREQRSLISKGKGKTTPGVNRRVSQILKGARSQRESGQDPGSKESWLTVKKRQSTDL